MNFSGEQLHIPDTEYKSVVTLPSGDFARICKELSQISENGRIGFISHNRDQEELNSILCER